VVHALAERMGVAKGRGQLSMSIPLLYIHVLVCACMRTDACLYMYMRKHFYTVDGGDAVLNALAERMGVAKGDVSPLWVCIHVYCSTCIL
jgi:hypothetical protein